jgi:hypothetical protein
MPHSVLLHPWTPPDLTVVCPLPPPGQKGNPFGFFDPASLDGPYHLAGVLWAVAMLALVLGCYLTSTASLNRGFVVKWYACWAGALLVGALVPLVVLGVSRPTVIVGSCSSLPIAFVTRLSIDQILPTALAAAAWAFAAFPLLSLAATALAGRHPASGGFFHYRGCPWPRWNPFAS